MLGAANMKIIKISSRVMRNAAALLKNGGVLVYPTDTAYALGADPANHKAVLKIYKIKSRAKAKALPLIAASPEMVKKFFKMNQAEEKLVKKYWPGPLSIVLDSRSKTLGAKSIAVRVPKNQVARELSKRLNRPIISTSANIAGAGECYSAKKVFDQFKDRKFKPDLVLWSSNLRKIKPSTIIQIDNGKIIVLRKGSIKPIWK